MPNNKGRAPAKARPETSGDGNCKIRRKCHVVNENTQFIELHGLRAYEVRATDRHGNKIRKTILCNGALDVAGLEQGNEIVVASAVLLAAEDLQAHRGELRVPAQLVFVRQEGEV